MGEAHFRTPTPPKPLNRFPCHVKYITTSPQGVDVQNLVGIDSAVTNLRMREKKTHFVWIFLLTYLSIYLSIYLSVCLSVSSLRLQVTVLGRFLRLMAQNDVISQPLVLFGGRINIVPY